MCHNARSWNQQFQVKNGDIKRDVVEDRPGRKRGRDHLLMRRQGFEEGVGERAEDVDRRHSDRFRRHGTGAAANIQRLLRQVQDSSR